MLIYKNFALKFDEIRRDLKYKNSYSHIIKLVQLNLHFSFQGRYSCKTAIRKKQFSMEYRWLDLVHYLCQFLWRQIVRPPVLSLLSAFFLEESAFNLTSMKFRVKNDAFQVPQSHLLRQMAANLKKLPKLTKSVVRKAARDLTIRVRELDKDCKKISNKVAHCNISCVSLNTDIYLA